MKKREEILLAMSEAMPYSTPIHLLPYIREAMDIYATEAIKADRERVINVLHYPLGYIDGEIQNANRILNLPIELL